MKKLFALLITAFAITMAKAGPVVIIKADDFRAPNQAWTNFLEVSRQAGIKVSIGIIAESIAGKTETADWLRAQEKHGDVEFWDHGWDHKQWKLGDQTVSEFGGSGLEHQRDHFMRAQAELKTALGHDVAVFGTPYNAFDTNTATIINETPALRLFFAHGVTQVRRELGPRVTVIDVISETGGTGKPDASGFEALWNKRAAAGQLDEPVSLQFHPPYFDAAHLAEYGKIIAFLKAQGCTIKLPAECMTQP